MNEFTYIDSDSNEYDVHYEVSQTDNGLNGMYRLDWPEYEIVIYNKDGKQITVSEHVYEKICERIEQLEEPENEYEIALADWR
jgi:hypothetical protein